MIGFGGLAVYTCNMFLVGILSLARRIKAGIAWKNSFLYSVVEFVKLLIRNARHIAKIIVLYLAYAAVHWVAYLASGWPSAFWSFVIFIVQTAGFVILVNWAVGRQKIKEGIVKISEGELVTRLISKIYMENNARLQNKSILSEADLMRQSRRI